MMNRRAYALLLLWILTGCTAQLHQHPPSSSEPAPAAPAPAGSCVALTVASSSWPTARELFTAWLEAQRVKACTAPATPSLPRTEADPSAGSQ